MTEDVKRATEELAHPGWCLPERCGHLVPPLLPQMLRRHRGGAVKIGENPAAGTVVTYLIGTGDQEPVVAVYAGSRSVGKGRAELSLSDVADLAWRLNTLVLWAEQEQERKNGAGDAHE